MDIKKLDELRLKRVIFPDKFTDDDETELIKLKKEYFEALRNGEKIQTASFNTNI